MNTNLTTMKPQTAFRAAAPKFGSRPWTPEKAAELREQFRNNQVLFWDVDTQRGFMWPNVTKVVSGALKRVGLYVTDALSIVPNLKVLTDLHKLFKIPLVASMDTHREDDPEFPLFTAVSDEHCREGAEDWPKIPETTPFGSPRQLETSPAVDDTPSVEELRQLIAEGRSVVVKKDTISAFQHRGGIREQRAEYPENPKVVALVNNMKKLGIKTAVVYGVATDFCNKAAVEGLRKLGLDIVVVNDAMKGVFASDIEAEPLKSAYDDVTSVSTAELKRTVEEAFAGAE